MLVADLVRPDTALAGMFAAIAAALLVAGASRWHGQRTLSMPIVWILHAGYLWIVIALALKAAWLLGGAPWAANWLHALTAGAFGTMILGVTTRVALGHSGRELVVATPIAIAYGLVIAGAALRIVAPRHAGVLRRQPGRRGRGLGRCVRDLSARLRADSRYASALSAPARASTRAFTLASVLQLREYIKPEVHR